MSKFKFAASCVIEAESEEDALNKIGTRLSAIRRHVAKGADLDETDPFFTLSKTDRGEPVDLAVDPLAPKADQESEQPADAEETDVEDQP